MIIYYTKKGKFEADNINQVPLNDLQSANENTPSYEVDNNFKIWHFQGNIHRLSGPAVIERNYSEEFWLDGVRYEFEDWLKNHPNQDISFQTKMKLQYT